MKKHTLVTAIAAGLCVHAQAQILWQGPAGESSFTDPGNWVGGSVPTTGQNALNNVAGTTAVIQTGDAITVNQVQAQAGNIKITGGTLNTVNLQIIGAGNITQTGGIITNTADARISATNGSWDVSGGTLNMNKMVIGSASGSTNTVVTISGNGVVNQDQTGGGLSRELWIGGNNGGSGSLILKDNASWTNANTSATAGANPVVAVGNNGSGQGTFTIQDSASFTYQNVVRVATNASNVGTVNLNGGTMNVAGFQRGSGTGTINANGGTLVVTKTNSDPVTNLFNGFTGTGGNNNNSVNLLAGGLKLNTNGLAVTVTNVLSGVGGLTKQGAGTLTLTAANTYTGATTITSGTLALTGSGNIASSSGVGLQGGSLDVSGLTADTFAVNNLSGAGAITATGKTVQVNGTLTPGGGSSGLLTVDGSLTLTGITELGITSAGTPGTNYDSINVTGLINYGGSLTVAFASALSAGTFDLFDAASTGGNFSSFTVSGYLVNPVMTFDAGVWSGTNGSQNFVFNPTSGSLTVAAVPEPAEFGVAIAFGLLAFGYLRTRSRRAQAGIS